MPHQRIAATLLLIICLLLNTDTNTAYGSEVLTVFLPLVLRTNEMTAGVITLHGVPVSGQQVTLTLKIPSGPLDLITDSGPDGRYRFASSPEMSQATSYLVGWKQTGTASNLLLRWICDEVSGHPGDQPLCGFDIAGVQEIYPLSCDPLALPVTFAWQPRGLPGEGYQLIFTDTKKLIKFPLAMDLTAAGSYTLSTLPVELIPYQCYQWTVTVCGSNGRGEDIEGGLVMFR